MRYPSSADNANPLVQIVHITESNTQFDRM
jgi:hypothetical protein